MYWYPVILRGSGSNFFYKPPNLGQLNKDFYIGPRIFIEFGFSKLSWSFNLTRGFFVLQSPCELYHRVSNLLKGFLAFLSGLPLIDYTFGPIFLKNRGHNLWLDCLWKKSLNLSKMDEGKTLMVAIGQTSIAQEQKVNPTAKNRLKKPKTLNNSCRLGSLQ